MVPKRLHEGVLLESRQPGEVQPAEMVTPVSEVVALGLDRAERGAPEAVELEGKCLAVVVGHLERVGDV